MKKRIFIIIIFCLVTVVPPTFAMDGNDLLKQVDRNLNPEDFEMYKKLINIEPDGSKKEFVMYSVKKGMESVASIFLSPASEKGRSILRVGDNMWLYIPNVGKPIRVTSLQSVTGGVFNNSDILRIDYSAEYNCDKLEKTDDKYILFLKAKTTAVAYDRLKMWVDNKRHVPTMIECFAASSMLIKTLYFKDIKDFGNGIIRPAVIETNSPLYKGYKSIFIFAKIKKKTLPDEVFTLNYMSRIDGLR